MLRLLLDTGSADLLALNVSYCQRTQSFSSHVCFNPISTSATVTPTVVSASSFVMGTVEEDGELLSDPSARAAVSLSNLPLQLQGSNLSVLLGASDVTLQDSLLGYPTAATQGVGVVLINPSPTTTFAPPIPYLTFPFPISSSYNSLADIDGYLGLAYNSLSSLAEVNTSQSQSAFLRMTAAIAAEPLATTFALVARSTAARHAVQWRTLIDRPRRRRPLRLRRLSSAAALSARVCVCAVGLLPEPRLLRRHRRSAAVEGAGNEWTLHALSDRLTSSSLCVPCRARWCWQTTGGLRCSGATRPASASAPTTPSLCSTSACAARTCSRASCSPRSPSVRW